MRRRRVSQAAHAAPTDDLPAILLQLAQHNLTVADLAQRTGVEAALLRRWLRGEAAIAQAERERIHACLREATATS